MLGVLGGRGWAVREVSSALQEVGLRSAPGQGVNNVQADRVRQERKELESRDAELYQRLQALKTKFYGRRGAEGRAGEPEEASSEDDAD